MVEIEPAVAAVVIVQDLGEDYLIMRPPASELQATPLAAQGCGEEPAKRATRVVTGFGVDAPAQGR